MTPVTRHAPGPAALLGTALLCTALLATACGNNTGNPGAPSSGSPSAAASSAPATSAAPAPSAAPSSTSASTAGCASSGLKVTVDTSQGGAAAGSVYVPIDFTNTTSSPCTLFGYPGVSFVTGPSGSQIGRPASRDRAAAAALVTLAPGGKAHATIQVADAGNYSASACAPVTAHWLKIFPPNQTAAVYAAYTVQACSAKLPGKLGHQLSVFVVKPGAGQAGQAP